MVSRRPSIAKSAVATGRGDDGSTGLLYGGRIAKDDPRTEAYGTVDEANAAIDPLEARPLYHRIQQIVQRDQPLLFLWEPSRLGAVRDGYRVHPNSLGEYSALREWTVETASAPESATAADGRIQTEAGDSPSGP